MGPVVLPNAMEDASKPKALPLCSCLCTDAMIAPAIGAAMAKPSAITHREASKCGKLPENAAKPAPAVYERETDLEDRFSSDEVACASKAKG